MLATIKKVLSVLYLTECVHRMQKLQLSSLKKSNKFKINNLPSLVFLVNNPNHCGIVV